MINIIKIEKKLYIFLLYTVLYCIPKERFNNG